MKLVNFYEVMDHKGEVEWGGASVSEAITWFRRGLDRSISVSYTHLTLPTKRIV